MTDSSDEQDRTGPDGDPGPENDTGTETDTGTDPGADTDAGFDPRSDPGRAVDEAEVRVFGEVQDPTSDDADLASPVEPGEEETGTGVDVESSG